MSSWMAAIVVCRVCSHKDVSIYPEDILEEDNQECSECHAMAAEPISMIDSQGGLVERD